MQGEKVRGRVASWVAGVVGVWAGVAALGALVAALMSPQWALVREPIVLVEQVPVQGVQVRGMDHSGGGGGGSDDSTHYQQQQHHHPLEEHHGARSALTTVTFRLGLWTACPRLNTSHLSHMHLPVRPPCSRVSYWWGRVSHGDLHLPAPAPLLQTVLARMRISTPFLVGACGLLCVGCLLAVVGRCCYTHAALVAALLFSLAGLSVGVGVVWFVSVVSEEYGVASGRGTTWSEMYAYRYGWSLLAAGGAGVAALLAALLTGQAHLSRHGPIVTAGRGGEEEGLARPLLRCRSDGCLGQRSITSDTLRTYLTCDSRRPTTRGAPIPPVSALNPSSSIVDLTRPHEGSRPPSRRASHATIVDDDLHLHHTLLLEKHQHQHQQQHVQPQQPEYQDPQQLHQEPEEEQEPEWTEDTSIIIEAPDIPPVVPPPPFSTPSPTPSPISPLDLPPPPPVSVRGTCGVVKRGTGDIGRVRSRGEIVEPPRLPEYNSFRSGHHTHSLPREARQLAVFRRPGQRSATLARPSKVSSEV